MWECDATLFVHPKNKSQRKAPNVIPTLIERKLEPPRIAPVMKANALNSQWDGQLHTLGDPHKHPTGIYIPEPGVLERGYDMSAT